MKLAVFLPLLSLAFADEIIRPGTIYISKMGDRPSYQDLMTSGDRLVVGPELTTFEFNDGSLKLSGTEMYLGINKDGKFYLENSPQTGFQLVNEAGSDFKRILNYGSDYEFELCEGNSIGYNSNCHDARKVVITYEDIIQPR